MTDSSSPCILGSFATNDRSHGGPLGGGRPLRLIACRRAFCFISPSLHLYLYSICERVEACEALNTPTTCHLHVARRALDLRFAICAHMQLTWLRLVLFAGFVRVSLVPDAGWVASCFFFCSLLVCGCLSAAGCNADARRPALLARSTALLGSSTLGPQGRINKPAKSGG